MVPETTPARVLKPDEVRLWEIERFPDYFDIIAFMRFADMPALEFKLENHRRPMILHLNTPYQPNFDKPAPISISLRRILGNVFWEIYAIVTISGEEQKVYGWIDPKNKRGMLCPVDAVYKPGLLFYFLFSNDYCRYAGGPAKPEGRKKYQTDALLQSIIGLLQEVGAISNHAPMLAWFVAIAFSRARRYSLEGNLSHCLVNGFATGWLDWSVLRDAAFIFAQEFDLSLIDNRTGPAQFIKKEIVDPAILNDDDEIMETLKARLRKFKGEDNPLTEAVRCWEKKPF